MVFTMVTRLRSRRAEFSLLPAVPVPRPTPREPSGTKRSMLPPERVRPHCQRVWRQSKVRGPSFLSGVNQVFTGEMPSLHVGIDFVASGFRTPRFSRIGSITTSKAGDGSSENRHREIDIHCTLNTDVALSKSFQPRGGGSAYSPKGVAVVF